ncbi:MAG: sialidase, partial [Betaproteobacteria bacterium]|nr:sialidase [Betaproteobacteria bacterium]
MMSRLAGIGFALFVVVAAVYAFAPRQGPEFPATVTRIGSLLLLDGETAGSRLVTVGEYGAVFVSDDGGARWQAANAPSRTGLTGVFFLDDQRGWAVGHDSLIIHTQDGGTNWQQVYSAPDDEKPLFDVWFADGSKGYAVGAYGSFLHSADGGESWQPRKITDDDKHLNAIARGVDGTLFIAGEAGTLLRSTDGGETW